MSRFRGLGAVAIALIALAAILYSAPHAQAQRQPNTPRGACGGTITGTLSASTIRMCDPVDVTVRMVPDCPVCPGGVNVVFVQVDKAFQAEWMVQESVSAFNKLRDYERDRTVRVGVVHYNSTQVKKVLQITDKIESARGPLSVPAYGHDPHGDFVGAARAALEMLREVRKKAASSTDTPCEFIIYFASTKNIFQDDGRNMLEAAQMIRGQDVELFVGCPENVADYCDFTRQMPATPRNYTEHNERGKLGRMVDNQMTELESDVMMRDLYMTQILPKGLAYVDGSASVPPSKITDIGDKVTLNWEWKQIRSTDPHTLTYRAEPVTEGVHAIEGWMRAVDMENQRQDLIMPTQVVTVSGMCLPPSPTPTDTPTDVPTPTPTDTPTNTPTHTPTPTNTPTHTPTFTPTPTPAPIYLPIIVNERCTVQWVYSDVVMVMDMSTSMNRATGSGRTKLEATLEAARLFLTRLDLTPDGQGRSDRVAVVGFNAKAWIEQGLTNDAGALHGAIDRLPAGQAQQTRLDLGFERGLDAVRPAIGEPNTTPVIILLTDGLPNMVPVDPGDGMMETTVRKAAQRAKEAGIRVYTVGVGLPEDINQTLMAQCASAPGNFFYTPNAEDLASIYAGIAYSFGCPAGRHDWGQPWP